MRNSIFILLIIITSCNSKKEENTSNHVSADSSDNHPSFNKNEELYLVYKIGKDTIDPNGNQCKMVEMKSAGEKYFTSCYSDNVPRIGDSIWVGYDKKGAPYIVSLNKENQR